MQAHGCSPLQDFPAVSGLLLLMAAVAVAKSLRPLAFDGWNSVADGSWLEVCNGRWWNVITPAFVHADLRHLLYNAFFFFAYGCLLERVVGSWSVVCLFVCGHVAGFLLKLLMNRMRHAEEYRFIGGMGCSRCARHATTQSPAFARV
jgi:membrane associated rhomboid family serine protease